MIRDFADRRGGGVLFLAGRFTLSDGGYAKTPMAEMMPLRLLPEKTWSRDFATATLTEAGRESVITRIEDRSRAEYRALAEDAAGRQLRGDGRRPNPARRC